MLALMVLYQKLIHNATAISNYFPEALTCSPGPFPDIRVRFKFFLAEIREFRRLVNGIAPRAQVTCVKIQK